MKCQREVEELEKQQKREQFDSLAKELGIVMPGENMIHTTVRITFLFLLDYLLLTDTINHSL